MNPGQWLDGLNNWPAIIYGFVMMLWGLWWGSWER